MGGVNTTDKAHRTYWVGQHDWPHTFSCRCMGKCVKFSCNHITVSARRNPIASSPDLVLTWGPECLDYRPSHLGTAGPRSAVYLGCSSGGRTASNTQILTFALYLGQAWWLHNTRHGASNGKGRLVGNSHVGCELFRRWFIPMGMAKNACAHEGLCGGREW